MNYTPVCPRYPAYKRRKSAFLLSALIGLGFIVNGFSAHAANITNLSGHDLAIEVATAQGFEPVVIAKDTTYSAVGKLRMRFRGKDTLIEENEEYAIWPDGTFGPQRRILDKQGRGSGAMR